MNNYTIASKLNAASITSIGYLYIPFGNAEFVTNCHIHIYYYDQPKLIWDLLINLVMHMFVCMTDITFKKSI